MCQGQGWGPAALVVAMTCTAEALVSVRQRCRFLALQWPPQQTHRLSMAKMQAVSQGPLFVVSLAV